MQLFGHAFIWSCVSGLMRFCDGSDEGTAPNFKQIPEKNDMETLEIIVEITVLNMSTTDACEIL
jgi:hypothetical protein